MARIPSLKVEAKFEDRVVSVSFMVSGQPGKSGPCYMVATDIAEIEGAIARGGAEGVVEMILARVQALARVIREFEANQSGGG